MVLSAKDILEREFLTLGPETNGLEASKLMIRQRHGFVVVVSADGKPEGIVSEWDYLSKITAQEKDPSKVRLSDIMSRDLVSVDASEGLEHVAQLMADRGIRRLLVVQNGKVIGVITAKTILERLREYVNKVSTQIARLQSPPF
jgi:CBS domain-containing protein